LLVAAIAVALEASALLVMPAVGAPKNEQKYLQARVSEMKGEAAQKAGNLKQAIQHLHKVVYLEPESTSARLKLEVVIVAMGKDPKSFQDRSTLGFVARVSGDFVGAIIEYEEALKIKDDARIRELLGDVFRVRDNVEDAIAQYQAGIKLGDSAMLEVKLGQAFSARKDEARAVEAFKRAAKLNPEDPDTLDALILGLENAQRSGVHDSDGEQAIKELRQKASAKDQGTFEYTIRCGSDPASAKRALDSLAQARSLKAAQQHLEAGAGLQLLKKYDEAIVEYKKALELNPNSCMSMVNVGTALQATGDYADALTWYRKALAIQPDNVAAKQGLVEVEMAMKRAGAGTKGEAEPLGASP